MDNEFEKKRIDTYRRSNDVVRALYGDVELGKMLSGIAVKNSLPKEKKSILIDLVGDIILGLKLRNTLEQELTSEIGLTLENARSITTELKPFLDKVGGTTIPEANLETKERLDLRPRVGGAGPSTATTLSAPVTANKESAKPLTREELMSALGGKRTMAQDIEAVRASREAAKSSWAPGTTNPPK